MSGEERGVYPETSQAREDGPEATPQHEGTSADAAHHDPRAKTKKKWPIVVGCVVAILVLAGAGFFVWHQQPSFCNAICHVPMDNYVEGYYSNEALCANEHYRADASCLDCHEPKIDEQIAEGAAWVRGDFEVDENGDIATVGVTADEKMCARSGCHDMQDVVAATADWGGEAGVNPHESHQGAPIDCSNCHGVHKASNMYCNACHDYLTPEGWTNPA